jgi:hypothetical protein
MCRPSRVSPHFLSLPGTAVPGYRLFRPCGTALLRLNIADGVFNTG